MPKSITVTMDQEEVAALHLLVVTELNHVRETQDALPRTFADRDTRESVAEHVERHRLLLNDLAHKLGTRVKACNSSNVSDIVRKESWRDA